MTNVDGIMNYKRKEEEDYYAILGCDESATAEQINAEYKVQALQYHPDKNAGDKAAEEKFQKLQEAKEILSDPEKRRNYDKWRKSGIAISYKQWLGMKEHVHQVFAEWKVAGKRLEIADHELNDSKKHQCIGLLSRLRTECFLTRKVELVLQLTAELLREVQTFIGVPEAMSSGILKPLAKLLISSATMRYN